MAHGDPHYELHGFEVSYFTAKVRVALRYKQLHFEEIRASIPEILDRTSLGFIPIVVTPEGETWQDTSDILDRLEARHPAPPLFPETPLHRVICALVESYADEFGVTPAMHTRWGSEEAERFARARFSAMMGSTQLGNRAADAMVKARFAVGATPALGPAIQTHLEALLGALSDHFEAEDFLLGGRMSLADCALMGPVYGHFFTDLASRRLLHETALPLIRWIEYCNVPTTDRQRDWFRADDLPATLYRVLQVMGEDAVDAILAAVETVEAWADEHVRSGAPVPRGVGTARSDLRGATLERVAQPYSLWMLQRAQAPYRALPEVERTRVHDAIAGTGWQRLLAYEPRHRIDKQGFELVFRD